MIPKGGDTIWGGLDWSPEEGYCPSKKKQGKNDTEISTEDESISQECKATRANYERIVSFGRDIAEAPSSEIERIEFRGAVKGNNVANNTWRDLWTEYHDMGFCGIKVVAEYKVYTAGDIVDMLEFLAPKMMEKGGARCPLFLWHCRAFRLTGPTRYRQNGKVSRQV